MAYHDPQAVENNRAAQIALRDVSSQREQAKWTPEMRARASQISKRINSDPLLRQRHSERMVAFRSDPAVKARYAAVHATTEYKEKQRKSHSVPEVQMKMSASAKKSQNRPEVVAKKAEGQRKWWANADPDRVAAIVKKRRGTIISKGRASLFTSVQERWLGDLLGISPENRQLWVKGAGEVDLADPEHKIAVEVQGCYWHGCLACGFVTPGNPTQRERDAKKASKLADLGWLLVVVWEHEIRPFMASVAPAESGQTP